MMIELRGLPVSGGSAVGPALLYQDVAEVLTTPGGLAPEAVAGELDRLELAVAEAQAELSATRSALEGQADSVGDIFGAHAAMLEGFRPLLRASIEEGNHAEHAVASVLHAYRAKLEAHANPVLAQRAPDVVDLERRMLRALGKAPAAGRAPEEDMRPSVVIARTITPSEVAAFQGKPVCALVIEFGGPTSHSALLAKSLGIPCVVGVADLLRALGPGDLVWVDGSEGRVVVHPDAAAVREAGRRAARYERLEALLLEESVLPAETRDGFRAALYANVEFPFDVEAGVARGAEGVGLYRSEFLLDAHGRLPSEAEQIEAYRWTLERLQGAPLTVRTYDFGSDKPEAGATTVEPNAALGQRSLRWCFANPDVFHTQLRALLRVAAEGDVRIMLPMVGGIEDVRLARQALDAAAASLEAEGLVHRRRPPLGVMVEIPAAAVVTDLLAREADFVSIGTNDLIQYGLAVDRLNPRVAKWFRPSHPSVLRMLRGILDACARHDTPVTLCGEMGGESIYTVLLFGMGLRAFSLTPGYLPRARRLLRSLTERDARRLAATCLSLETADEVEAALHERVEAVGHG